MFHNYLTVAVRAFLHRKLYSFINVAGLTVCLTAALFILLFIQDETSWDAWEKGNQDVYQLTMHINVSNWKNQPPWVSTPYPLAQTMKRDIPLVTDGTQKAYMHGTFRVGEHLFAEDYAAVRPNFFRVIELPFVKGDAAEALKKPDSIVLTETAAKRLLGTKNAVGKSITLNGNGAETYHFIVRAILKDPPENTQFRNQIYISDHSVSYHSKLKNLEHSWFSVNGSGYIRLIPGTDPAEVEALLPSVLRKYINPLAFLKTNLPADKLVTFRLMRLRDAHLDAPRGSVTGAGRTLVHGLAAVALLLLCIAIFNFTNLSTACASLRAREVCLRKTVGASRRQLMVQFLTESVLTALIALLLALAATEILLPAFNGFLGRHITFSWWNNLPLLSAAFAIALICGVLGGIYPAFVLSRFRPGAVLKSNTSQAHGSGFFRNTLVVGQFAISIGLGIAVLGIFSQISYARKIDLGFDSNNVVVIRNGWRIAPKQRESFRAQLVASRHIAEAGTSWTYPFNGKENIVSAVVPKTGETLTGQAMWANPEYFRVYNMRLLGGRFFDRKHRADQMQSGEDGYIGRAGSHVLIDQRMMQQLGLTPATAVGKTIRIGLNKMVPVRIIGVVANVEYRGAQTASKSDPIIYFHYPDQQESFSVKIRDGHMQAGLKAIGEIWQHYVPNNAIQYGFMNDAYQAQFAGTKREGTMFLIFVGIAIFTACMGLFGVAAFTAERRKKEISIRKVFGATKGQIIRLLLWRFSVPVLAANIIAWPLAYLWLRHWLEGYAYHIAISPVFFVASGLAAIVIAVLTISANAWQTASVPPAHALRSE